MVISEPIGTSRLIIRKETEADAKDVYEILTDYDVMRYICDGRVYTGSLDDVRKNCKIKFND